MTEDPDFCIWVDIHRRNKLVHLFPVVCQSGSWFFWPKVLLANQIVWFCKRKSPQWLHLLTSCFYDNLVAWLELMVTDGLGKFLRVSLEFKLFVFIFIMFFASFQNITNRKFFFKIGNFHETWVRLKKLWRTHVYKHFIFEYVSGCRIPLKCPFCNNSQRCSCDSNQTYFKIFPKYIF